MNQLRVSVILLLIASMASLTACASGRAPSVNFEQKRHRGSVGGWLFLVQPDGRVRVFTNPALHLRIGLMTLLKKWERLVSLVLVFAVTVAGCNGCIAVTAKPDPEVIRLHTLLKGKVAVGSDFILAVKDGKVYGWGTNAPNLPTPEGEPPSYEKPVTIPIPSYVTNVSAAWWHSVALDKQGQVWVWGSNQFGGLGVESNKALVWGKPHLMENLPLIKAISAGGGHTLALDEDGGVWAWGGNQGGESGEDKNKKIVSPHKIDNLPPVNFIYAAPFMSFVISDKGAIYVWGDKSFLVPHDAPQNFPYKLGHGICKFTEIDSHHSTVFVCDDGGLQVIGDNIMGDLALGDKRNRTELTVNPYLKGVLEVRGTGDPRIALLQDGRVYGWGDNAYGVSEFTNSFMRLKPVKISVGQKIVDIASIHFNAFLVTEKGEVLHWMPNESWLVNGLYYFLDSYHFEKLKNENGKDFYIF